MKNYLLTVATFVFLSAVVGAASRWPGEHVAFYIGYGLGAATMWTLIAWAAWGVRALHRKLFHRRVATLHNPPHPRTEERWGESKG